MSSYRYQGTEDHPRQGRAPGAGQAARQRQPSLQNDGLFARHHRRCPLETPRPGAAQPRPAPRPASASASAMTPTVRLSPNYCRQGAVRLPAQPRPGEFDHCRAHASVAVFSDPLFTFAAAAREWRSAEPDISAERAPIMKLPYERLTHEKWGEVRTDRPQVRQRADHPFRFVRRRVPLENGITRRLHLFNQLQNEIKTIEQTFDARSRLLRNGITVRLAHGSQLLAAISSRSLPWPREPQVELHTVMHDSRHAAPAVARSRRRSPTRLSFRSARTGSGSSTCRGRPLAACCR